MGDQSADGYEMLRSSHIATHLTNAVLNERQVQVVVVVVSCVLDAPRVLHMTASAAHRHNSTTRLVVSNLLY